MQIGVSETYSVNIHWDIKVQPETKANGSINILSLAS